jgi:hypothetical protein
MERTKTRTYAHIQLNEEVPAIGGHYVLEKEVRLPYHGEEVLYVVGMGIVDNSCCAPTGCKYAIVPGFILDWHSGTNSDQLPVTEVQPIRDEQTRKEITALIKQVEFVQHVEFH